jgi:hypothetical protein
MAEIIAALGWTLNVTSSYDLMPARGFLFHTACLCSEAADTPLRSTSCDANTGETPAAVAIDSGAPTVSAVHT